MNDNITYWLDILDNCSHHIRQRKNMGTHDIANILSIVSELSREISREQSIAESKRERTPQ